MIDPDRIFDIATAIKNAVVNFYAADPTADNLPDRIYVADSPLAIANTCEQFTVACERIMGTDINPAIQTFEPRHAANHAMRSAVFQLAICRCSASRQQGQSLAADEEESARRIYGDAGRMFNALVAEEKAGGIGGCNGLVFLDWLTPPVEGRFATGTMRIQLSLMRTA